MSLFAGTELYRPPRCERCDALESECQCLPEPPQALPPEKHRLRIRTEKRKRGKQVTLVLGLGDGTPEALLGDLLTRLKNHCGAGGTLDGTTLEIQGNHAKKLSDFLSQLGYRLVD